MYDAIVVGARCAGATTAFLLARAGARVLLLERETFPRDTLNGHGILAAGARRLDEWGLLDPILATGCQPFDTHTYEFGPLRITGKIAWDDGVRAVELAPRRFLLDPLLADAAVAAGAELRMPFVVEDLVWEGERVVGVRGREAGQPAVEERAHLVIGADGFRSRVAATVEARVYEAIPPATCIYYSHWSGMPCHTLEVYVQPGQYEIVFPSNDDLTLVGVGWEHAQFPRVRADIEGSFMAAIDAVPSLAERVHSGRREERFRGTADLPMFLRRPHGPGWALVGDAGCRVDPITGQGLTDAFRDAALLTDAIIAGLSGDSPIAEALAEYQRRRDAAVLPVYRYTAERARLQAPDARQRQLLAAISASQSASDRFAGLTAGTTCFADFFAPPSVEGLLAAA
jgi:flavin-dependent dehydrogenase